MMKRYGITGLVLGCFWLGAITLGAEGSKPSDTKEVPKYPSVKVTGFIQLQFLGDQSSGVDDEFKVHRARAGVKGKLKEEISYNLIMGEVEPPDRDAHLVNAFVDLDYVPWSKIRAGQFLVPFGIEGPQTIILNPAIERSTTIKRLNPFNMFRGVGVQASNKSEKFDYALAVVNGTGANTSEDNNYKDVLGRFGITPSKELNLRFSGHRGRFVSGLKKDLDRIRYGVGFEYLKEPFRLRGEFIHRQDETVSGSDIKKWGWYLLGGYRFLPKLGGIVRYEQYDPNTKVSHDRLNITTLGLNYYLVDRTRLSINYEFRNDDAVSNMDNLLTMQLQVVF